MEQLKMQTEHGMQLILLGGHSQRSRDKATYGCVNRGVSRNRKEIHLIRAQPWLTTQTLDI